MIEISKHDTQAHILEKLTATSEKTNNNKMKVTWKDELEENGE